MKILLLGDASNYHRALSSGLRARGHEVTVASGGSGWMNTERDINLNRTSGKLGGALLYGRLRTTMRSILRGYDVVHISSPGFLPLRPGRLRSLFDRLKRDNGAVFLTALSADSHYVKMCSSENPPLPYSEWKIANTLTPYGLFAQDERLRWISRELESYTRHIYDNVDGAITALYEYDVIQRLAMSDRKVVYAGIPIDTSAMASIPLPAIDPAKPIRIMVAYHRDRMLEKGTDRLLEICRRIERDNPDRVVVDEVTGLPYSEFVQRLGQAHVVVDQMYSLSPGTTGLLTLAAGRVSIGGGDEAYYRFINESDLRPIINTAPESDELTRRRIEQVIFDPTRFQDMAGQARQFVEKHNSVDIVAGRVEALWKSVLH